MRERANEFCKYTEIQYGSHCVQHWLNTAVLQSYDGYVTAGKGNIRIKTVSKVNEWEISAFSRTRLTDNLEKHSGIDT